jgi:hypothetical protein
VQSAHPAEVKVSEPEGKDSSKRTSGQSSEPDPCPLEPWPLPEPLPLEPLPWPLPLPLESPELEAVDPAEDVAGGADFRVVLPPVHDGSFRCSGSLQRSVVARGVVEGFPTDVIDSAAGTDASDCPAARYTASARPSGNARPAMLSRMRAPRLMHRP